MVTRILLPGVSQPTLTQQIRRLISRRKGIRLTRLHPYTDLHTDLGFDMLDLVDIILELERQFGLCIPDEVPLHTVADFVQYLGQQLSLPSTAQAA